MNIEANHIELISKILLEEAGLHITEDKKYLLESRLKPIMQTYEIQDWDELSNAFASSNDNIIRQAVIEAMTTNETLFFRDPKVFDYLKNHILPDVLAAKSAYEPLKIWCCACATGQEPYSVAMLLEEELSGQNRPWSIKASDIDNKVLEKASKGSYTQFDVQRGLSAKYLVKDFEKDDAGNWKIKSNIKEKISFFQNNLLQIRPMSDRFDVIFCRNVLYYMPPETRHGIIKNLKSFLKPGGYLILGTAECFIEESAFQKIHSVSGVFQLPVFIRKPEHQK